MIFFKYYSSSERKLIALSKSSILLNAKTKIIFTVKKKSGSFVYLEIKFNSDACNLKSFVK